MLSPDELRSDKHCSPALRLGPLDLPAVLKLRRKGNHAPPNGGSQLKRPARFYLAERPQNGRMGG